MHCTGMLSKDKWLHWQITLQEDKFVNQSARAKQKNKILTHTHIQLKMQQKICTKYWRRHWWIYQINELRRIGRTISIDVLRQMGLAIAYIHTLITIVSIMNHQQVITCRYSVSILLFSSSPVQRFVCSNCKGIWYQFICPLCVAEFSEF